MTVHKPTAAKSDDHPYKSQCSCGAWYYLWSKHMKCIESGCNCWARSAKAV